MAQTPLPCNPPPVPEAPNSGPGSPAHHPQAPRPRLPPNPLPLRRTTQLHHFHTAATEAPGGRGGNKPRVSPPPRSPPAVAAAAAPTASPPLPSRAAAPSLGEASPSQTGQPDSPAGAPSTPRAAGSPGGAAALAPRLSELSFQQDGTPPAAREGVGVALGRIDGGDPGSSLSLGTTVNVRQLSQCAAAL